MQYFKSIDLVIVGIGVFTRHLDSNLFKLGKLRKDEIKELKNKKVVGDCFAHFFNSKGKFIDCDINKRTIAISVEDFMKIKYRLAVACGIHKLNAIQSALKGQIINYLVTDAQVGQLLIEIS